MLAAVGEWIVGVWGESMEIIEGLPRGRVDGRLWWWRVGLDWVYVLKVEPTRLVTGMSKCGEGSKERKIKNDS